MLMRNSILASIAAAAAVLAVSYVANPAAQQRQRVPEGFISEGIPKMPNPPGPAPKRDISGTWVGPGVSNKPDPVPPMTPAGQAAFKERKSYGVASRLGGQGRDQAGEAESNDPFITCDPLGFPRNLLAHAITARGGTLFATAPGRILIGYEQQRIWREIWRTAARCRRPWTSGARPNRATTDSPSATGRTTPRSSSTRPASTSARGWTRKDTRAAPWRTSRSATRAWINTTSS